MKLNIKELQQSSLYNAQSMDWFGLNGFHFGSFIFVFKSLIIFWNGIDEWIVLSRITCQPPRDKAQWNESNEKEILESHQKNWWNGSVHGFVRDAIMQIEFAIVGWCDADNAWCYHSNRRRCTFCVTMAVVWCHYVLCEIYHWCHKSNINTHIQNNCPSIPHILCPSIPYILCPFHCSSQS